MTRLEEMNPRSTHYEADALTTPPSRQSTHDDNLQYQLMIISPLSIHDYNLIDIQKKYWRLTATELLAVDRHRIIGGC